MLRATDFIIDDNTPIESHTLSGGGRGLIPRDYEKYPQGSYRGIRAFDRPLIPRDQWVERIREKVAHKAQLSDLRRSSGPNGGHIPSLDQADIGYCWNHSATMGVMLQRALMGQPYVRLSAFMIGCLVTGYQDEGGWGAQAVDFIMKHGVPSVEFWPEKSMKRSNDTPEMRENAKRHIITEGWMDMSASIYDRNLTEDQAMTCLLENCPVISDYNWWGHSVLAMDAVIASDTALEKLGDLGSMDLNEPKTATAFYAAFGKREINSWTDSYGDLGEFVLTGQRAILDGGIAIRAAVAA